MLALFFSVPVDYSNALGNLSGRGGEARVITKENQEVIWREGDLAASAGWRFLIERGNRHWGGAGVLAVARAKVGKGHSDKVSRPPLSSLFSNYCLNIALTLSFDFRIFCRI